MSRAEIQGAETRRISKVYLTKCSLGFDPIVERDSCLRIKFLETRTIEYNEREEIFLTLFLLNLKLLEQGYFVRENYNLKIILIEFLETIY